MKLNKELLEPIFFQVINLKLTDMKHMKLNSRILKTYFANTMTWNH